MAEDGNGAESRGPAVNPLWTGIVFLVIGVTIGGIIGGIYSQQRGDDPVEGVVVSVAVDFGDGVVLEYHNVALEENSALAALMLACDPGHGNTTVKTTYYAAFDAVMVDAVGNCTNGDGGRYWQYYINGELPMVSADNIRLNTGDEVRWSFEVPSWT